MSRTSKLSRILSVALSIALVTSLNAPIITYADDSVDADTFKEVTVQSTEDVAMVGETGHASLKEAVEAANASEGGATIELLKDVALSEKLTIKNNVAISGNHTIARADNYTGTLFVVNSGAALTLDGGLVVDGGNNYVFDKDAFMADCTNRVRVSKEDSAKWFTPEEGAPVATAFMFTTTGGTVNLNKVTIQNNYSTNSGVVSAGANSTITLTGARIAHVAATQGNGVVANVSGANINVIVNEGTIIDGNHVGGNHGLFKIYSGAKLTLNGGEVTNNTGWNSNGTVVGIYWGTFEMNGGTLCSNAGVYGPNNGRNAAVYGHSGHNFLMTGGTICHNIGAYGGLDAPYDNGTTKITGGAIVDNVSTTNNPYADINASGKLEVSGGTFTQNVSAWLAPNVGIVYNEEPETYSIVKDVVELNGKLYPSIADAIAELDSSAEGVIKVVADHKVLDPVVIEQDVVIDLNGRNIIGVNGCPIIRVQGGADVVVKGEGSIVNNDCVFVLGATDGSTVGNLTITSGSYKGDATVASVIKGVLTINSGEFSVDPYVESEDSDPNYNYTLDCVDANYTDGSASIVVNGGRFFKFDPSNNTAEGDGTSFVANTCISYADGDYFTVYPAATTVGDDPVDPDPVDPADPADPEPEPGDGRSAELEARLLDLMKAVEQAATAAEQIADAAAKQAVEQAVSAAKKAAEDAEAAIERASKSAEAPAKQAAEEAVAAAEQACVDLLAMLREMAPEPDPSPAPEPGDGCSAELKARVADIKKAVEELAAAAEEAFEGTDAAAKQLFEQHVALAEKAVEAVEASLAVAEQAVKDAGAVAEQTAEQLEASLAVAEQAVKDAEEALAAAEKAVEGVETVVKQVAAEGRENAVEKTAGAIEAVEKAIEDAKPAAEQVFADLLAWLRGMTVEFEPNPDPVYPNPEPSDPVPVEPEPKGCDRGESCPVAGFGDADLEAWYHDGLHWAVENGVMSGYDDGSGNIGPADEAQRGALLTMLHRIEGKPAAEAAGFADVETGAWYEAAVNWAFAEGLTTGYTDGSNKVGALDEMTREQLATFMFRYAQYKGIDTSARAELSFADAGEVSSWAVEAVQWAVAEGIISGYDDGSNELGPVDTAQRAQVATMLMRMDVAFGIL